MTLKHKELTQLRERTTTLRTVRPGNHRVYHTNAASSVKDCNLCRNKARQQLLMPRLICVIFGFHMFLARTAGAVCLSAPEPQRSAS